MQKDFYRFIFENSLDAMLLTHPEGSVYRANAAACEMFQMTQDEICASGRGGLVDSNDPRLSAALAERTNKGKVRIELIYFRKDGSRFTGDTTSAVFLDDNQKTWTVVIIRDITKSKENEENLIRAQEEVRYYALYDDLTQVLNRRAFIKEMQNKIEQLKFEKEPVSLILADIDSFKKINDTYGHSIGDDVLKQFSRRLKDKIRSGDILGRYGGDEFILFLPHADKQRAIEIAERLRAGLKDMQILTEESRIDITASFGLACFDFESDDLESIIKKVDTAMYHAKSAKDMVYTIDNEIDFPKK